MSIRFTDRMLSRMVVTSSVGTRSGSVMYRSARQKPAPSMRAASYSVPSMPWSPASTRIIP